MLPMRTSLNYNVVVWDHWLVFFFFCFWHCSTVVRFCSSFVDWHFVLFFGKIMYAELSPNGSLKLYHFIAMVTVVMIVISQLPSFHSLRHINLGSLLLSLGYSFLVVVACIYAGNPLRTSSIFSSRTLLVMMKNTCIFLRTFHAPSNVLFP